MLLTPTELERLTIFSAAELARKRKERGVKLNHPEAVAIIVDEVMERAREGKSVAELISYGSTILTTDDVMPGVADLMPFLQVEPVLKTGTKLVPIHEPIRAGKEKVEGVVPGRSRRRKVRSRSTQVGAGPRLRWSTRETGRSKSAATSISSKQTASWNSTAKRPSACTSTFRRGQPSVSRPVSRSRSRWSSLVVPARSGD